MPVMYINIGLFALGVGLIVALFKDKLKDSLALRLIFFSYFLVVMQYNFERIQNFTVLLTAAGVSFILWTLKRIPASDEDLSADNFA
jgi:hypothetical protein